MGTDASTPQADDGRLGTGDAASGSKSDELKSPKKGPLFSRGGVLTSTGGGTKQKTMNSFPSVPGLAAGAAVGEGSDDSLSTTERFLMWRGHGGPP
jgi:hypothetical protein